MTFIVAAVVVVTSQNICGLFKSKNLQSFLCRRRVAVFVVAVFATVASLICCSCI